jgi:hypothetical protein
VPVPVSIPLFVVPKFSAYLLLQPFEAFADISFLATSIVTWKLRVTIVVDRENFVVASYFIQLPINEPALPGGTHEFF